MHEMYTGLVRIYCRHARGLCMYEHIGIPFFIIIIVIEKNIFRVVWMSCRKALVHINI